LKVALALPRVHADGLIRFTTSEYARGLRGIECVSFRVQPLVRDPAPFEFREEWLEPESMLVEDRDGTVHVWLQTSAAGWLFR
jgi:hypothetical protein